MSARPIYCETHRPTRCGALHLALALGLAVGLASAACKSDSEDAAKADALVTVQAAVVRRQALERLLTAEAVLYPRDQAAITPKISAPVREFYVNRGDHVRRGQLLARLENRDLAAAATETRGALDQAQASYQSMTAADLPQQIQKAQLDVTEAKQTLDQQQRVYDSRQNLFRQGAIPRRDLDQAALGLTQARNTHAIAQRHLNDLLAVGRESQARQAAGQLESARGKFAGAEAQLAYSEIRSPIDGVVTDRPLYPGELATTGAPVVTVMDVSTVIAKAHIAQQQAALLKPGDAATIRAGELQVAGRVKVVSPALDPNSTTVEIWVEARNPEERLRPGSTMQLTIHAGSVSDALTVPVTALQTSPDGGTSVMIVAHDPKSGDVVHPRPVQVGIRQGDVAQITSGLEPGDEVVTVGGYGLDDNTHVKVEHAS